MQSFFGGSKDAYDLEKIHGYPKWWALEKVDSGLKYGYFDAILGIYVWFQGGTLPEN